MTELSRYTLIFKDPALEREYDSKAQARTLLQGRIAVVVGCILYLSFGILDSWYVPSDLRLAVWLARLIPMAVPAAVLMSMLMSTRWFHARNYISLAMVGLAAGTALLIIFALIPVDSLSVYYPALVMVTFWSYNFSGSRFIYAFVVDMLLLAGYTTISFCQHHPLHMIASHIYFIVISNLLGGGSGYLQEYQNRQLFLREREINAQRLDNLAMALHDRLTGLPNRQLLQDRMEQALGHAMRDSLVHAGFFIDLDGFKMINDRLGHEAGDRVLNWVAGQLRQVTRDSDTVARLGGDEFFVLGYDVRDTTGAQRLADRMLACIAEQMPHPHEQVELAASIGICMFPFQSATVKTIVHRSDLAMYEAKKKGKNCAMISAR
jgi:diguanylate cyclase